MPGKNLTLVRTFSETFQAKIHTEKVEKELFPKQIQLRTVAVAVWSVLLDLFIIRRTDGKVDGV